MLVEKMFWKEIVGNLLAETSGHFVTVRVGTLEEVGSSSWLVWSDSRFLDI